MNRPSPPKPWERPGSSNPIRPSPSSPITSPVSTPTSTSLTTTTSTPRPPLRPWERNGRNDYDTYSRSSYGGYGNYGSSYGSSYGSNYGSNYGGYGSSYGSSYGYNSRYGDGYGRDRDYGGYGGYNSYGRSYGNDYGYGGYGSSYGGYGGYGRDPYDKSLHGFSFFNNLQYFVDSFSRLSRLLDANYDAMHGSFSSIVRLIDHMGRLNFEVMTVIKTFALFRILQSVISRTFGVFSFLLPWRSASSSSSSSSSTTLSVRDFQNFANLPPSSPLPPNSPPSWRTLLVVFLLAFVGLPMAVNKMFSVLSRRNPMEIEWNKEGGGEGRGEEVVALHEFRGESNRELSFNKGDVLTVINKLHPDWWEASLNGQVGVIPANFVSPFSTHDNPDNPPMEQLKLSK